MSTASSIPSKPIMIFQTPKPKDFSARFIYNYYTKDEFVAYSNTPADQIPPRKIELTFTKVADILQHNTLGTEFNEQLIGNSSLITELGSKLTSETLLQSNGFIRYTSETERNFHYTQTSTLNSGDAVNTADAFFENASTVQGANFATIPDSGTVYLNPSTNRPTSEAANSFAEEANESLIATDFVFDLIEASAANPFSIHSLANSKQLSELQLLQTKTRRNINPTVASTSQYIALVDMLDIPPEVESTLTTYGMGIIGYILFKSEVDKNGEHLQHFDSRLILGLDTEILEDTAVRYGRYYQYALHPLMIVRRPPSEEGSEAVSDSFVMVGAKSKIIRIHSVENVPPPPVEAIQFVYLGNGDVGLRWSAPVQYAESQDRIIGDIKGYQIFKRENVNYCFELEKYITFNDMIGAQNFPLQEYVPNALIKRAGYHVTNHIINLKKDKTYIIGMCTIDAHGNSSNLSPQYYVRIDSFKNSMMIDFASFKGAPKQYPNLMMSKKVFLDSIKVSNKPKMTVYFCPKTTHVLSGPQVDPADYETVADPVIANSTEDVPSYRIQLINVDKQEDKIFDIFLRD